MKVGYVQFLSWKAFKVTKSAARLGRFYVIWRNK